MRRQLLTWGAYAFRRELTSGRSGNMSVRAGDGHFLVTASGSSLGALEVGDVVRCPVDGQLPSKPRGSRPSMEAQMHRLLYRKLSGAGAVFHSQPLYGTLFACTGLPVPLNLIPESMAYIPRVVRIPYAHAGSKELARSAADALELNDVGLLENHGLIVASTALADAVLVTETFEMLCTLLYKARAAGMEMRLLPDAVREDFLRHLARVRGYGRD